MFIILLMRRLAMRMFRLSVFAKCINLICTTSKQMEYQYLRHQL